MSWNGSGSIVWPYDWTDERDKGNPDNIISAAKFDTQWADAKAAIEATLNRDGENSAAANISWGGFLINNLGAALAGTDAIRARQVAENAVQYGGTTAGSSNTYTLTQSFVSTVGTGTRLLCLANHTNTGAATLNVNGAGAVAIVRSDGATALAAGDIVSGDFFEVAYDGTSFCLISTSSTNESDESYQPLDTDLTAIAALANTKGNVIVGNGSAWTVLTVGANDTVLTADSAEASGVKWATNSGFDSGTGMVFYQASAPTGWTAVALNDRTLRVVTAGGTGGTGGGSTAFSSVFTSRTIAQANLPNVNLTAASNGAHTHLTLTNETVTAFTIPGASSGMAYKGDNSANSDYSGRQSTYGNDIGQTSSNGAHTHTVPLGGSGTAMDFAVHYSDVIIATKD